MNIKRIFAAAVCTAMLSGCGVSEPPESEINSSSQAQSESSVKSEPSTAGSHLSSSSTSSSTTSSSTSSTLLSSSSSSSSSSSLPSNSSSQSEPSPPASSTLQKQLGGTDDWAVLFDFLESHPNVVMVNVDDLEDTTNTELYEYTGMKHMRIPYTEIAQRYSEIPSGRPVIVYGQLIPAATAYAVLTNECPDIPEVMYFFWIPIQMPPYN